MKYVLLGLLLAACGAETDGWGEVPEGARLAVLDPGVPAMVQAWREGGNELPADYEYPLVVEASPQDFEKLCWVESCSLHMPGDVCFSGCSRWPESTHVVVLDSTPFPHSPSARVAPQNTVSHEVLHDLLRRTGGGPQYEHEDPRWATLGPRALEILQGWGIETRREDVVYEERHDDRDQDREND